MMPLSELLKRKRPVSWPSVPAEPVEVRRAARNIRRRWPDADTVDPEIDPEALALAMERRRRNDDWRGFFWADVRCAAIALLESGLWQDQRFDRLFDFMLDQIGPGATRPANGTYVRSMFRKYLDTFDSASTATHRLAKALKQHWADAMLPIGSLVHHFRIFDPDTDPPGTIAAYMDNRHDPFRALRKAGMDAPHGPGLMQAAHMSFVSRLAPRIRSRDTDGANAAKKLLDWIDPPRSREVLQGPGAGEAIDALLSPWYEHDPEPAFRELVAARLVSAYHDPRVNPAGMWSVCSSRSRDVILKWLTGHTIQLFFDIVTQADSSHMWSDRKSLWSDLYRKGRITQAWFALSKKGEGIARSLDRKRDGMALEFAENRSLTPPDRQKCLLMMSIDGRWVVEGSHNFPTWVFPRKYLTTFRPYEKAYTCEQFRHVRGLEKPERIVHSGGWKNSVLTALER